MPQDFLLIVGAGPTGMLLAIYLKTLAPSIPLQIIDKAPGPGTSSRAMIVHARTIEFYRQLDLADELLEEAQIMYSAAVRSGGGIRGSIHVTDVGKNATKYPMVLAYPQHLHERLLLRRCKKLGIKVQWNTALEDLRRYDDRVEATFGGRTVDFTYVAGCDGAHSIVRQTLAVPMTGGTYPQLCLVADIHTSTKFNPAQVNVCPGSDGFAVFIPLKGEGNVRVFLTIDNATADMSTTFEELQPSISALTNLTIDNVLWSSVYRTHHRVAAEFRQGRAFLVGDAAHLHSPVGGQGMNTGLGDAVNLAWKLASVYYGKASADILDTYDSERREFAEKLVNTTDRAFVLVTGKGWMGWVARCIWLPFVLPLLWRIRAFREAFFHVVSQLGIAYLHSRLSTDDIGTSGKRVGGRLRAGQRLPWVDYGDTDNFAEMCPPRWQIHVYGESEEKRDEWNMFPIYHYELSGAAKTAGFLQGLLYLVRPDGHIALICTTDEYRRLHKYMINRWGLVA